MGNVILKMFEFTNHAICPLAHGAELIALVGRGASLDSRSLSRGVLNAEVEQGKSQNCETRSKVHYSSP
jgi:hypothetical protein